MIGDAAQHIGEPGLGIDASPLARNRKFASISLQRRVSCELDPTASATCLPASHAPAPPANADSGFAFLLYRWRLCRVSGIAV